MMHSGEKSRRRKVKPSRDNSNAKGFDVYDPQTFGYLQESSGGWYFPLYNCAPDGMEYWASHQMSVPLKEVECAETSPFQAVVSLPLQRQPETRMELRLPSLEAPHEETLPQKNYHRRVSRTPSPDSRYVQVPSPKHSNHRIPALSPSISGGMLLPFTTHPDCEAGTTLLESLCSPCQDGLQAPSGDKKESQRELSIGTAGHPYSCGEPCKYVKKSRGCKDGSMCSRCHLCVWGRGCCKKAVKAESFHDSESSKAETTSETPRSRCLMTSSQYSEGCPSEVSTDTPRDVESTASEASMEVL